MNLFFQLGPFVLLLLAIALMPVLLGGFWEHHRNKALVTLLLTVPSVCWLLAHGLPGSLMLLHALREYGQFILLLAALYAISGLVVIHGELPCTPASNTLWLALGAVLANVVGTTGASMLLLRPMLRANHHRTRKSHIPLFFIFIVANCGGLLLPLGDPPLFLGFLHGVDFFWPLCLWRPWLLVNGLLLVLFFVWDSCTRRLDAQRSSKGKERQHLRVEGLVLALLFVLAVMGTLLLQAPSLAHPLGDLLRRRWPNAADPLLPDWGAMLILALVTLAAVSILHRPSREVRLLVWAPLVEVAILFAGIFLTLAPALALLATLPRVPWTAARLLWITGGLSSVLDNAPTYLAFATLADPGGPASLARTHPELLQAISCGAVWMGALTYIGNGPNFLIRGIAEHVGYSMPSFFGYLAYSLTMLLPVFALATLLFFC